MLFLMAFKRPPENFSFYIYPPPLLPDYRSNSNNNMLDSLATSECAAISQIYADVSVDQLLSDKVVYRPLSSF